MKIQSERFNGRQGWRLSSDVLSIFVMAGGGHIADLRVADRKSVNPFWKPAWKTIEPWQFKPADESRYGCKLLASISGHNLCLGSFGDASPDEMRAGLGPHGEAPVARWKCSGRKAGARRLAFSYGCDLPAMRASLVRTIVLREGSHIIRVSERLRSKAKCDTPFTMCQHVTFGPPFVEPGVTIFDMSAKRGSTFPGAFSDTQRLKESSDFTWPDGPGQKGKVDLCTMGKGKNSDFLAMEMDRDMKHAWFSALNPRKGLMVAYVWRRDDYPWTGIWEESFARKGKPWNGKSLTRGMEFTNSPLPVGLRKSVDMGSFKGQPAFRWLGALRSRTFDYSIIALPVDEGCRGVASITPDAKGFVVEMVV